MDSTAPLGWMDAAIVVHPGGLVKHAADQRIRGESRRLACVSGWSTRGAIRLRSPRPASRSFPLHSTWGEQNDPELDAYPTKSENNDDTAEA